ncbi:uncharacterized protein LOC125520579 isoform X2 [Triticum urartu]|uniref:uncharacterized protein LOC125520579 isoform X2 n=1 Tax=Triticum urartu TaxID=4572 RepID=UPI00204388E7|nr:uncharacterized protein LOC125520579 isoform X2 [Triticum urartu]
MFLCTPHLQARSHDEMVWSWYYVDSEGARLKGSSRFCSSLYAYGILDEGYKFNMSVEEAAELAWRAFITQYSVTELVVAVFLVVDDCEVIGVLLQTELVPLCLRTMEMGSELSTLLSWLCFFLLGLTDQFLSGRKAFSVRLDLKKQSKIWLSFLLTWLVTSISLIL